MKYLLLLTFSFATLFVFGQAESDSILTPTIRGAHIYYIDGVKQYAEGTSLDSIFCIDSISGIQIEIDNHTYKLSKKQCRQIISILKKTVKSKGLHIKPNNKEIRFTFKGHKDFNSGSLYFSLGKIHFDYGIDRRGDRFDGTFILPDNFDLEAFVRAKK